MKSDPNANTMPLGEFDPTRGAGRVLNVGRFTVCGVTALMAVLAVRVVQLQIAPPPQIDDLVDTQYSKVSIPARRAPLFDRSGRPLAVTTVSTRLFVDPHLIKDHNTFAEKVGYALGYDPAEIEKTINARPNSRFIVLDHELSADRKLQMASLRIPGLGTQRWLVREYPQGSLAAPIVGFVGRDGKGLEGLELEFNDRLVGEAGKMHYLRDAARNPMFVDHESYQPHRDGQAVNLSLDITLQKLAEEELTAACQKYDAKSAMLVAMDPHTGEIFAMANYPSYDLRKFGEVDPDVRRNRCVTDAFEPGSTFKPFIWAVGTEGKFAHPDEMFNAHGGLYITNAGRRLRDAHGYGQLTWSGGLIKSSNIVMAQVGERMSNRRLYDAVRAFGFGSSTNSQLPGEIAGLVNPLRKWNSYTTTSIPMGQEIGVTALQVTRAACVFANDGLLVTPTIVLPPPDDPTQPTVRIYERVLTPQAAQTTRQTMRLVMTEGTGRRCNSELYTMFGKTGTAQVARTDGRGYEPGAYLAAFIGGAPLDNPRIVVGVFIKQPDPEKGYYGGTVAGPVARNVIERSLIYLGVPTENHIEDELAATE